jgi:integrase
MRQMSKKTNKPLPKLCRHKRSGLAYVTLDGRQEYLGTYGTPEANDAYLRIITERNANGHGRQRNSISDITIVELIARYWQHVLKRYVKDGEPTGERHSINSALIPLKELYRGLPVNEFTTIELKAVRQRMIERGWARSNINRQIKRVVAMYKWGVEHQFVSPQVYMALKCVAGLRRGQNEVKESERVKPVAEGIVLRTAALAPAAVSTMIQLQLRTGMRSLELCVMRGIDIETNHSVKRKGKTVPVWLYRPHRHKTQHHDQERVVWLGPEAQKLIEPWLVRDLNAYLFDPRHEAEKHMQGPRSRRGLMIDDRARPPAKRYSSTSYRRAVTRACELAFPHPDPKNATEAELAKWNRAHHWTPHQLRHTAATSIRKRYSLDDAKAILGHASADMTQEYAERDQTRARAIMAEVG